MKFLKYAAIMLVAVLAFSKYTQAEAASKKAYLGMLTAIDWAHGRGLTDAQLQAISEKAGNDEGKWHALDVYLVSIPVGSPNFFWTNMSGAVDQALQDPLAFTVTAATTSSGSCRDRSMCVRDASIANALCERGCGSSGSCHLSCALGFSADRMACVFSFPCP